MSDYDRIDMLEKLAELKKEEQIRKECSDEKQSNRTYDLTFDMNEEERRRRDEKYDELCERLGNS